MDDLPHQRGVVLADDHEDLLREIRELLTSKFEVLDAVTDGMALVAAVRDRKPDVVISDIRMPRMDGIEACRSILQENLCSAAVVLTMCSDGELVNKALDAGIRGYVLKVDAAEELVPAVTEVLGGSTYLSRGVRQKGKQILNTRYSGGSRECKSMPRTRLLLADDHAVVAKGLEAFLQESFDLVGTVHDGRSLVQAAEKLRPDVILTDISMPLLNGLDAIRQIRERRPDARIIVLTMHRETQLAVEAFRAGASGYVLKVSPPEELITAIQEVAQGRAYITTLLAKDLITVLLEAGGRPPTGPSPLTARQREVLQLIAEGKTMKEVAAILDISPRTAESHKYEIMQTLGVQTTAELVQHAVRLKLVGE